MPLRPPALVVLDVSTIANVATALAVIVALAFGILQLRQLRRQREEAAAFEALRGFQTDAFMRSIRNVWYLPPGARARDVSGDAALEDSAVVVSAVFHAMGHLVARGFVPMEIADEQSGAPVIAAWARLERWVRGARRQGGTEEIYQWFEWFAIEAGKRRDPAALAAITHASPTTQRPGETGSG